MSSLSGSTLCPKIGYGSDKKTSLVKLDGAAACGKVVRNEENLMIILQ
jgi:hypothetical protein